MLSDGLAVSDPIPEKLDDYQLTEFQSNGFLHVRGFFSAEDVSAIRSHVDDYESAGFGMREHLEGGFFSYRGMTLFDRELACLACDGRFLGPVVQILGPCLRFLGVQSIRRDPLEGRLPGRTPERPGWHRDIYGMARDVGAAAPLCAIKCGLLLSDTLSDAAGGTRFLPGSQLHDGVSIPSGTIDPLGWVSPKARAGDVIFFENRIFHAGGLNNSKEAFRAILFQYGYRWLAPVIPGRHSDTIMHGFSALTNQLLEPNECVGLDYRPGTGLAALSEWAQRHSLIKARL